MGNFPDMGDYMMNMILGAGWRFQSMANCKDDHQQEASRWKIPVVSLESDYDVGIL